MKNKGNAKSLYSKKQIQKALIKLMNDKKFEDISIKEISDHAEVSRKTFYRNFESKKEVLFLEVEKISMSYINELNATDDLKLSNIVLIIFMTANKNFDFLKLLVENDLLYLLMDKLYEEVNSLYKIRKKEIFDIYGEENIANTLLFSFGGFEKYLKNWMRETTKKSPIRIQAEFEEIKKIAIDSIINDFV